MSTSQDLETLLQHRADVLRQLSEIGDLRQGSLTAQYRKQTRLPLRKGTGAWAVPSTDPKGEGQDAMQIHPRRCGSRVQIEEYKRLRELVQQLVSDEICDARLDRSRGDEVKKKAFEAVVAAEASSEINRLVGDGVTDDMEAVETAAKRAEIGARAVAKRFNRSDHVGPSIACASCGGEAHGPAPKNLHNGVGRSSTGLTTAATPATPGSAHGTGRWKKPPPLPRAWSGSQLRSFAMTSSMMKELAGLKVAPKMVERIAEALGTEEDERQRVEVEPPSGPTMYVGMDGTGVPARPSEREGRPGKQPDGSSKTREAKLVTVWTAEKQSEGTPEQGSAPSASPRPPTRNCRLSLNGSSAKRAVAASTTPSDAWFWGALWEHRRRTVPRRHPSTCSMRNSTCGAGRKRSTVTEILRRRGRKSSATPLKTVRSTRSSRLSASTAPQATWNGTARACSTQNSVRRVCLRRRRGRLQENGRQPAETGAVDRSGRGRRTPVLHAQRALRGLLGASRRMIQQI